MEYTAMVNSYQYIRNMWQYELIVHFPRHFGVAYISYRQFHFSALVSPTFLCAFCRHVSAQFSPDISMHICFADITMHIFFEISVQIFS